MSRNPSAWALLAGSLLCATAFLAWLWGAHLRDRRWFDRPDLARRRGFDLALALVRWALFAAGLQCLWRGARLGAALVAGGVLLAWAWKSAVRSAVAQRFVLRREYDRLRRARPDLSERDLLVQLVLRRHPGWGEELIAQMVLDYETLDDLARVVARMERGFRGFG